MPCALLPQLPSRTSLLLSRLPRPSLLLWLKQRPRLPTNQLLHVLTSPSVVGESQALPDDWSVGALLARVATSEPPLHALVDTGALVTGLSNLEAATRLLELGLRHVEG